MRNKLILMEYLFCWASTAMLWYCRVWDSRLFSTVLSSCWLANWLNSSDIKLLLKENFGRNYSTANRHRTSYKCWGDYRKLRAGLTESAWAGNGSTFIQLDMINVSNISRISSNINIGNQSINYANGKVWKCFQTGSRKHVVVSVSVSVSRCHSLP